MRAMVRVMLGLLVSGAALMNSPAQTICPLRPSPGSPVLNPLDLFSQNGVLTLDLLLQNQKQNDGYMHYCYIYMYQGQQVEAPTLRLNPGDRLILTLTNNIQSPYDRYQAAQKQPLEPMHGMAKHQATKPDDDCSGQEMMLGSTNIHFHGMNISPTCHQDDVINTIIQSGDPPFQYNIQVPANDPPGMFWYHPHVHGNTTTQVEGGAAGAIIIEGNLPGTQGLPERVLVIRQQFQNPDSWIPGPNELTVNFQPATYPQAPSPIITVQNGQPEFWRLVNATTQAFLTLQIQFGSTPQPLQLLAVDGVPLQSPTYQTTLSVPPAGRVEFITPGLPAGLSGTFLTNGYNTGPVGNPNPVQVLASMVGGGAGAKVPPPAPHVAKPSMEPPRFAGLATQVPTARRSLYFSEQTIGSNGPTQYFITVQGQWPKVFTMDEPPAIVTNTGAVEDWTIENHAGEAHAFHIHQIHFLVMAINGVPVPNPYLADTITIPNWSGSGSYPSVTLRMDFRDPNIAGTFVYHCHILDHEDGGMMAKIQVNPAN